METAHDTIVESDNQKVSRPHQSLSSAWLKMEHELAEQAGWKRFGTIGYDNYRTWILNNQPTFKAR